MQGRVLTPIKCSVQIDSIGRESVENDEDILYKYKDIITIPPLGMIDDVISINECGAKAIKMNALIQNKVNCKRLTLGPSKCFHMHIGKNEKSCPSLLIGPEDDEHLMNMAKKEKYLGNIITDSGK